MAQIHANKPKINYGYYLIICGYLRPLRIVAALQSVLGNHFAHKVVPVSGSTAVGIWNW